MIVSWFLSIVCLDPNFPWEILVDREAGDAAADIAIGSRATPEPAE
jgi:hypothetical protein